jgi:putative oxidoreductase
LQSPPGGYARREVLVRRLFSTFARGWPGIGLLLIRMVAGGALIVDGFQNFQGGHTTSLVLVGLAAIGDGALLLVGLWTPIAGCVGISLAFFEVLVGHDHPYPAILLAAIGAALALVGPGEFSVDARLFGWKRINI